MGSDKALLSVNGESQLSRGVALLERHLSKVFVSTRPAQHDDAERKRYPQIVDRYEDLGPVAGVLSALETHPEVAWLVIACDLPHLDDAAIGDLLNAYDPAAPFTAYASSDNGLPEPLCAIYSPAARTVVSTFVAEGIRCPRKMMLRAEATLLEQRNPQSLDNMNTPEDLALSPLEIER